MIVVYLLDSRRSPFSQTAPHQTRRHALPAEAQQQKEDQEEGWETRHGV